MSPSDSLDLVRSALFLPASNERAVAKAPGLDCDIAILDLEDAVKAGDKATAREAAIAALAGDWHASSIAIRVNGIDTPWHEADIAALAAAHPEVPIYTAAIDARLNEHGYIVPGLGDAGDRMYGTK